MREAHTEDGGTQVAGTLEKMRSLLRDLIEVKATQAEVGSWLGIDQSQVSRILNGKAPLELERLLVILAAVDVSQQAFFSAVFDGEKPDPAAVLYLLREHAGLPPDSFLENIEAGCAELGMRDRPAQAQQSCRRSDLLQLEDLRFVDSASAKQQLEELIRLWIGEANSFTAPPPTELLGDIAIGLAIWASIQRICGRRDDASSALEWACQLAEKGEEPWILGLVRQKSAYLLMDSGNARYGIVLLREAHFYFSLTGDNDWQAKIWVDLGILHNFLGEHEKAIRYLQIALERLPERLQRNRFAAHYDLAIALQFTGHPEEAQLHLAKATALRPPIPLATAYLKWREGSQCLAAGALDTAVQLLEVAHQMFEEIGVTGDTIFILLDLAEVYFRQRNGQKLADLADWTGRSMKFFRQNKRVFDALQTLALICFRGKGDLKLLAGVRQQLEAEFPNRLTLFDQV